MKLVWPQVLAATLVPASVHAATLGSDSLICETGDSIVFVKQTSELAGQPGSVVMSRAKAYVQFVELQKDPALPRSMRADADRISAKVGPYAAIASGCAASGPSPLPVEVLERKPISGVTKIRTMVNGAPAEVYVRAEAMTE